MNIYRFSTFHTFSALQFFRNYLNLILLQLLRQILPNPSKFCPDFFILSGFFL